MSTGVVGLREGVVAPAAEVAHGRVHHRHARLTLSGLPPTPTTTLSPGKLDFYNPLKEGINEDKNQAGYTPKHPTYDPSVDPWGRKALLLDNALHNYEKLVGTTSAMHAVTLKDPQPFRISATSNPDYFKTDFPLTTITHVDVEPGFYSYSTKSAPEATQFWVDFANKKLGGGVFSNGFVQEETMFLETPELANAAALAKPIITRTGSDPGVLKGSPTPWMFLGVNRVMALNQNVVGHDAWKTISVADLDAADVRLTQPENINVLAIAAPKLPKSGPKATMPIVKDLFNTFVSSFALASTAGGGQPIRIHTGPIGAGVFYNDRAVVYVLQRLAALEVGKVNLTYWSYSQAEVDTYNQKYFDPIMKKIAAAKDQSIDNVLKIASKVMAGIVVKKS